MVSFWLNWLYNCVANDGPELFYFMCVFCLLVCMCTPCVQFLWWPEEGVRVSGIEVTDSCSLPSRCWKLNPDSLQEQSELVRTSSDISSNIMWELLYKVL